MKSKVTDSRENHGKIQFFSSPGVWFLFGSEARDRIFAVLNSAIPRRMPL
jgi:hypothetical protein